VLRLALLVQTRLQNKLIIKLEILVYRVHGWQEVFFLLVQFISLLSCDSDLKSLNVAILEILYIPPVFTALEHTKYLMNMSSI